MATVYIDLSKRTCKVGSLEERFEVNSIEQFIKMKCNIIFSGYPSANLYAEMIYAGVLGSDFDWLHYWELKNREDMSNKFGKIDYFQDTKIRQDMMSILNRRGKMDDKGNPLEPYADELYDLYCKELLLPYLEDYINLYGRDYDISSERTIDGSKWYVNKKTNKKEYSTKTYENTYKNIVDMIRAYQSIRFMKENNIEPLNPAPKKVLYTSRIEDIEELIELLSEVDKNFEVYSTTYDPSTNIYTFEYTSSMDTLNHHVLNRFLYGDDREDAN